MNKNLQSARRKIEYLDWCDQWYGILTPSEIVALVDAGAELVEGDWHYDSAKEDMKKGECRPTCFYFKPGKLKLICPRHDPKPKKH